MQTTIKINEINIIHFVEQAFVGEDSWKTCVLGEEGSGNKTSKAIRLQEIRGQRFRILSRTEKIFHFLVWE